MGLNSPPVIMARLNSDAELRTLAVPADSVAQYVAQGWTDIDAPGEALVNATPYADRYTLEIVGSTVAVRTGQDLIDATTAYLERLRQRRYAEFDARTEELISEGFTFNSKTFSLSNTAQRNLLGLWNNILDPQLAVTYPVTWPTIDDSETESLPDDTTAKTFVGTALATVDAVRGAAAPLKNAVRAATTEAAILAVVDPR